MKQHFSISKNDTCHLSLGIRFEKKVSHTMCACVCVRNSSIVFSSSHQHKAQRRAATTPQNKYFLLRRHFCFDQQSRSNTQFVFCTLSIEFGFSINLFLLRGSKTFDLCSFCWK